VVYDASHRAEQLGENGPHAAIVKREYEEKYRMTRKRRRTATDSEEDRREGSKRPHQGTKKPIIRNPSNPLKKT
jgi:hypothetical protein